MNSVKMNDIKRIVYMGALVSCAPIFCACQKNDVSQDYSSTTFFAMDTVMEIQIDGDETLLTEAEQRVMNLEDRLSVTKDGSEVSKLNSAKIGRFSKDSTEILTGALQVCADTDGALDISIYPVLKEWGFTTGEYKVPSEETIEDLLSDVDYSQVQVAVRDDGQADVVIPEDMEIDLGSVVKGYTSQMLADYFTENGVDSALINLGGNVQCIGRKTNGNPWKIAIKSPFTDTKTGILGVLEAEDVSIITSGGYERYFEEDGQMYWHILDPATGHPAKNGLVSVSIIGTDGLKGDGLSTSLFVKGLDAACDYWREHQDFDAIFVTDDEQVYITEGVAEKFQLSQEYADFDLKVINK